MEEWNIKAQWIGSRDISDHCPISLVSSNKNWVRKPFKCINGWLEHKDAKLFMETKWKECKVDGLIAHIVNEKLKYVKENLNVWNREVYGVMDLNIDSIVKEINKMVVETVEESVWDG